MCGIVGYIGYDKATPLLLSGLKRLEYRGYDSSGVAFCQDGKIEVIKAKGKLSALEKEVESKGEIDAKIGIGHTRWATHGIPSVKNAHPHVSQNKKFAVVHNGIIENYIDLKENLKSKGVVFNTDTDTEVIAQLAEYLYDGDFFSTIKKVRDYIKGSYALAILCDDFPDQIIGLKKASPLIIGLGENENFLASDVTAVVQRTKNMIRLDDDEMVVLRKNSVKVFDKDLNEIRKEPFSVDWDVSMAEKGGFDHFMLKEIMEQPKALKNTIEPRIEQGKVKLQDLNFSKGYLDSINKICIIGCGSAYHVGCVAKYIFEKMLRKPVEVEIASEFRYKDPLVDEKTLVIVISQSGETADTLAALREAKKRGAKIVSIVNVVGSSIANESDKVIYTWAGPEIAVATTKAYSTQLSIIYLLAIYMAKILNLISDVDIKNLLLELNELPEKLEKILSESKNIKSIAQEFKDCKNIFFIGRNIDYAVAMEGSLKAKEISYINSEAYAAGELKHGTISLIEEGAVVIAVATQENLFEKMISTIREVKARGATVILIATDNFKNIDKIADYEIYIPKSSYVMQSSLTVIPLQIFAYYIALFKGCDIDKPRNLAKSVTVE